MPADEISYSRGYAHGKRHALTNFEDRIDELAEMGEISGQVAYYLKNGTWPEMI